MQLTSVDNSNSQAVTETSGLSKVKVSSSAGAGQAVLIEVRISGVAHLHLPSTERTLHGTTGDGGVSGLCNEALGMIITPFFMG